MSQVKYGEEALHVFPNNKHYCPRKAGFIIQFLKSSAIPVVLITVEISSMQRIWNLPPYPQYILQFRMKEQSKSQKVFLLHNPQ